MVLKHPSEYPDVIERGTAKELSEVSTLSEREIECLQLRHQGRSDQEIAKELDISKGTVSTYIRRGKKKGDKAKITLKMLMEVGVWEPTDSFLYEIEDYEYSIDLDEYTK